MKGNNTEKKADLLPPARAGANTGGGLTSSAGPSYVRTSGSATTVGSNSGITSMVGSDYDGGSSVASSPFPSLPPSPSATSQPHPSAPGVSTLPPIPSPMSLGAGAPSTRKREKHTPKKMTYSGGYTMTTTTRTPSSPYTYYGNNIDISNLKDRQFNQFMARIDAEDAGILKSGRDVARERLRTRAFVLGEKNKQKLVMRDTPKNSERRFFRGIEFDVHYLRDDTECWHRRYPVKSRFCCF